MLKISAVYLDTQKSFKAKKRAKLRIVHFSTRWRLDGAIWSEDFADTIYIGRFAY